MALGQPPRHSLIDVVPEAWAAVLAEHPLCADAPMVRDWIDLGHPLIARRRMEGDAPDHVAAALPLPPALGKRRLAFALPRAAIAGIRPPPALATVASVAPPEWRQTIDALLRLADELASTPRVFGSFAWAALTGLAYIAPTSDLDLLWPLNPSLPTLLDALARIEQSAPGRIDGEILGPSGAVQWKELCGAAQEVLVKRTDAVTLVPRTAFVEHSSTKEIDFS